MRKILVSAYGCEPFRGSEAGVGWNWVLQLAKDNELFVITRLNDKEKIEMNIPKDISKNVHFYYYDTCSLLKKLKKKEKGLYIYYWFWQIGIISFIKKLTKQIKFDYSMHLSFGSLWMPTFLPFFKVPFIWGPIGGGDGVPKSFIKTLPLKQRIVQSLRYVLIRTSFINPLVAIPSKKAVAILCRTENNTYAIPKKYRNKIHIIIETSMTEDIFEFKKEYPTKNNNIELITTGRLVPFKNTIMSIDIMKELVKEKENIHLTLIGSGSEYHNIKNRIEQYNLEKYITIIKQMPRYELLKEVEKADIFLFPSLREGGSWALMEGMAIGLPVVCFDWTGMKMITDEKCAMRIKPSSPEQSKEEFVNCLKSLINDKKLRENMGKASRERIKNEFNWNKKREFAENLFKIIEGEERKYK